MTEPRFVSVASVVEVLGGTAAVGRLCGVLPKVGWKWTRMNAFPSRAYCVIQDELERLGLPPAPRALFPQMLQRSAA